MTYAALSAINSLVVVKQDEMNESEQDAYDFIRQAHGIQWRKILPMKKQTAYWIESMEISEEGHI